MYLLAYNTSTAISASTTPETNGTETKKLYYTNVVNGDL